MADRAQPKAPKAFKEFVQRFPELGEAWQLMADAAAKNGPLDEKRQRLVKLGIALGTQRSGSVSSAVRKGSAVGITQAEMEQVVALAASTIGLPASVAAFGWIREALTKLDQNS